MRISEPLPRLTPDLRVATRDRERDGRHQASADPMGGRSTRPDLIIRARTIQSLEEQEIMSCHRFFVAECGSPIDTLERFLWFLLFLLKQIHPIFQYLVIQDDE